MSSVPALKEKKVKRDKALAEAAQKAAADAAAKEAQITEAITARAQAYEEEYEKVSLQTISYKKK